MRYVVLGCILALLPLTAGAAEQADAVGAVNAAAQAEDAAAALGNRWLPAEAALKAARAALASGGWDEAVAQAARAHALADRAVEQSREQKTAWRDAVIR